MLIYSLWAVEFRIVQFMKLQDCLFCFAIYKFDKILEKLSFSKGKKNQKNMQKYGFVWQFFIFNYVKDSLYILNVVIDCQFFSSTANTYILSFHIKNCCQAGIFRCKKKQNVSNCLYGGSFKWNLYFVSSWIFCNNLRYPLLGDPANSKLTALKRKVGLFFNNQRRALDIWSQLALWKTAWVGWSFFHLMVNSYKSYHQDSFHQMILQC